MEGLVRKITLGLAVVMLLGAGQALASPKATAAEASPYFTERASTLFSEIRTETAEMNRHAETLGTFAWKPQISWQGHAFYLNRVKGHINNVGERIAELQRISDHVQPWQQKAIEQLTSHALQLASSTSAAIVYLSDNQGRLFVTEYRDHLTNLAERSDAVKETVDKYRDYEKAQDRFQRLQNEMELDRS